LGKFPNPKKNGFLNFSRFLFLHKKFKFFKSNKKKKKKKKTRCPSLGSLPSPLQLLLAPQDSILAGAR
jgi:hypothetical protein